MSAHVDPAAGLVSLGTRSWPFDLDLATESITVTVDGGRRLRLRPLRWREKLVLARFAHLGSAFVERQLVRACLVDEGDTADRDTAEAVAALARWINEPNDADQVLPLDQALLAEVTIGVCRALGVRPDDLDGRTAAEVERLWQATPEQLAAPPALGPADGGDDLTRIVIVPDLEPGAETGGDNRHPPAGTRPTTPAPRLGRDPGHAAGTDTGGLPRGCVPRHPAELRAADRGKRPAVSRFQVLGDPAAGGLRSLPLLDGDATRPSAGRLRPVPPPAPHGPDSGKGGVPVSAGGDPTDPADATASVGLGGIGQAAPGPLALAAPAARPAQAVHPDPEPPVASPTRPAPTAPSAPGATGFPAAGGLPAAAMHRLATRANWPPAVAGPAPSARACELDARPAPGARRAVTSMPFPEDLTPEGRAGAIASGRAVPSSPGAAAPPVRRAVGRWDAAALDLDGPSERLAAPPGRPVGADTGVEPDGYGGRGLSEAERDALFEELSERLEQAAAEMGVDLEG